MYKKGFTLAEVLTTLLIIGIIAALTIPLLLQSMEDKDRRVAYNKSVAVLAEAIQQLTAREIGCGTIADDEDLAKCLANVFIAGTLDDNVLTAADGQSYIFFWRKGANGTYSDCGEKPLNTEKNWKGSDANCLVVIDVNGPHRGSVGHDDYSVKTAVEAPSGEDHFPMILTLHSARPTFYEGSLGFEYSYGIEATADVQPWNDTEDEENNVTPSVPNGQD